MNSEDEGRKERKIRRERQLEIKSVKVKSWSICFLFRLPGPEISRPPAAKEARQQQQLQEAVLALP